MLLQKCDNFSLKIELRIEKPADTDFKQNRSGLGLQYGADFELSYSRNGNQRNPIGILQFVKPSQPVGNPLGDEGKNLYIDKEQLPGKGILKDYLFGVPGRIITYNGTWVTNQPVCTREVNESTIRDTPREIIGYDLDPASRTLMLEKAPKLVFYDFWVEIQNDYCLIYPLGVGFTISVEQKTDNGSYLNAYDLNLSRLSRVNFHQMKLNEILQIGGKIDPNSYKVVQS